MDLPAGWTVLPSPLRWDLLFHFNDLRGTGRWCRLTNDGNLTVAPLAESASRCVMSHSGSRAILIGHSSFYEGAYGLWSIVRSIVDFGLGSATSLKLPIKGSPVWSNDETRLAYCRATDGEPFLDKESTLAIRHLGSGLVLERQTPPIHCLRWGRDDRRLFAVIGTRDERSLISFSADDLTQESETALAIEPIAEGLSLSPDAESVSFCVFPMDDDDAPYFAYIYRLEDGQTIPIGPQRLETQPVWSPTGRKLVFDAWKTVKRASHQALSIFNPNSAETTEIATINSGDLSGDISGPDPVWSPDGERLAFVSYEESGSAIYVANLSTGTHAKALQTDGLVHAVGFVGLFGRRS